jgi:hypothetical protein
MNIYGLDLEKAKDVDETVDFRMNKNAVTALEARVALYQKNYIVALAKSLRLLISFSYQI